MWQFEHKAQTHGYKIVAGVDEAGRGPLAGPVVSAAVILPQNFECVGINDSKKLSEKQRNYFFTIIRKQAIAVSTGIASHDEIDQINILQASLLSMKRAVENLSKPPNLLVPDFVLIDGKFTINMDIHQTALIKGDSRSISIAAASIIAKITRDAIMVDLHKKYPHYNFIQHKGYATCAHREAIVKYGPCPVHRRTFKGVKEVINAG